MSYFFLLNHGSVVKNPSDNAGDVSLISDREDPLEKEMATHTTTLAWEIPWTEEPGGATVYGVTKGHDFVTKPPPPPPGSMQDLSSLTGDRTHTAWPPGSPNSSCLLQTLQFHPP